MLWVGHSCQDHYTKQCRRSLSWTYHTYLVISSSGCAFVVSNVSIIFQHLHTHALLHLQVVHDYEHGGSTNDFLISQGDIMALTYNDKVWRSSCLEVEDVLNSSLHAIPCRECKMFVCSSFFLMNVSCVHVHISDTLSRGITWAGLCAYCSLVVLANVFVS